MKITWKYTKFWIIGSLFLYLRLYFGVMTSFNANLPVVKKCRNLITNVVSHCISFVSFSSFVFFCLYCLLRILELLFNWSLHIWTSSKSLKVLKTKQSCKLNTKNIKKWNFLVGVFVKCMWNNVTSLTIILNDEEGSQTL